MPSLNKLIEVQKKDMSSNFHEDLLPGAWKIGKYPPPGKCREKISADVILGGNMKRGRETARKCKRKRKKGERKKRKG